MTILQQKSKKEDNLILDNQNDVEKEKCELNNP